MKPTDYPIYTILTNRLLPGSHHHVHLCPVCGRDLRYMFKETCEHCGQPLIWTQDIVEIDDEYEDE